MSEQTTKFVGFRLVDALAAAGLHEPDAYFDRVTIDATKGEPCKLTYWHPHNGKRGGARSVTRADKLLEWEPLFEALKETGLLPEPTYCRSIHIDASRNDACTVIYHRHADSRLLDVIASGAIVVTDDETKAVVI